MSVLVIAIAAESGVPIFSRKRGNSENIQFSTIASLHGINMFSKCHNLSVLTTMVDNGSILWKDFCKSITLIGIVTGGLECDLELLLSSVYDTMIFCISKKELETLKNLDQVKRDLRQCYPIIDRLLESLDPNTVPQTMLVLDLIPSVLCPQAQQLQAVLDNYAEKVTGRWACLSIHGQIVATSSDFCELDPREARLLLILAATQDGAPLRDTLVYLPQMSPNVAFRAVTCKLLMDVYILVMCGASPALAEIDEIVLQCWEAHAPAIKEAKLVYPRNFPASVVFDPCLLGILVVNITARRSVFSRHLHAGKSRGMSGAHRTDILRTFYVTTARHLIPDADNGGDKNTSKILLIKRLVAAFSRHLHAGKSRGMSGAHRTDILRTFYVTTAKHLIPDADNGGDKNTTFSRHLHAGKSRGMAGAHRTDILRTFYVTTARHLIHDADNGGDKNTNVSDTLPGMVETYWCSEYHKCHAQRSGNLFCCALYAPTVPTHTTRLITGQILQELASNKDIHW